MRRAVVLLFGFWGGLAGSAFAQRAGIITSVRLADTPESFMRPVIASFGKVSATVADRASGAWIVMNGTAVAYASDEGVGGFENEGQSLHLYTASTGKTRKVLTEYFMIDSVWSVRLTNRKWALLVAMSDGGLGAEQFAVVDPARGEVFLRNLCRVRKVAGDFVTLDFYTVDDWGLLVEGSERESKGVKPRRTERVDLKKALAGKRIANKRNPE